ncbi:MAG: hypothetical protein OHK0053_30280 [Microscillaceae bacterium]
MSQTSKQTWIAAGYRAFAQEGPAGLKIEVLAQAVFRRKSSFYHHFGNLEHFTECLLRQHLERAKIIAQREKNLPQVIPDLIELLLEVKEDLFFSRQLRIHRHIPAFQACFQKADAELEAAFLHIWAEAIGLDGRPAVSRALLDLAMENFYLQITEESLTYDWLLHFIQNIRSLVSALVPLESSKTAN